MFVLLTTPFILALGKILCLTQLNQEVKYSPSPFLSGRTPSPGNSGNLQPVIHTVQPYQTTEQFLILVNKNNGSATSQQTTTKQKKTKLLISRSQSRRMNQKQPVTVTTNNITSSTSAQNNTYNPTPVSTNNSCSENKDKVVFEEEGAFKEISLKSVDPIFPNESTSNNSTPPVTEAPPPANVTLEDRGAFDGDACPTGYVRVNGVCVMPD